MSKIFIGADHRGYAMKKSVIALLEEHGYSVVDKGTFEKDVSCDYPKIACAVGSEVAKSKNNRGILVCMTGIGQCIAANKIPGCYAALCYNKEAAALSRQHNNANIIVLSGKFIKKKDLKGIVLTFLGAEFEGGRHQRRVRQIKQIEKGVKGKKGVTKGCICGI